MYVKRNNGRPRRPMRMWSQTDVMEFGNTDLDVGDIVKSRSQKEVKEFVREHSDMADSSSFDRIIAFDTECSVNYADHCEMCSFGYAEFDLDGNELNREEIYIKARPAKGRLAEKCQADPEKYTNAPTWKIQFPKIKEILTRPNTIYLAHSCRSDIGFLMQMNRQFGIKQFYFRVFDTFEILQKALPDMEKYNLPFLAESLNIEHDSHVSLSDAIVCFRVLEEAARINETDVKTILQGYQDISMFDSLDVLRENFRIELRHAIDEIKGAPASFRGGPLRDHRFTSTKKMEKADPEAMLALVRFIVTNGGEYVPSMTVATDFIWDGDTESGDYEFARTRRNLNILRIEQVLDGRFGKFPAVCQNLLMLRHLADE